MWPKSGVRCQLRRFRNGRSRQARATVRRHDNSEREPDWREVSQLCPELLPGPKDLRIGCTLAHGLLMTEGLRGFADGLALIRGYLDRYWPTVHPLLDPEDDNDPTLRVNTVASLSDHATTVQSLRAAPMVKARVA